jgi:N-formylglutamate deformylase
VIPRIVRDGADIYRGKLDRGEAEDRLARFYRPYHQALQALIDETRARFGVAVLIDCHSMPSALSVPDVVLGDRYGASAGAALTRRAEDAFSRAGFSVARNTPYAGGHTTVRYGKVEAGCHVLQIEINRALYLNEERVTKKAAFHILRARLERVMTDLLAMPLAGLGSVRPQAAE